MCSMKTMLKVALGLLLGFGLAYATLPEFRGWLIAMSPTLLFLICPISMLVCMAMMNKSCNTQPGNTQPGNTQASVADPLPKPDAKTS